MADWMDAPQIKRSPVRGIAEVVRDNEMVATVGGPLC
jgi:hypothetical protein